MLVRMDAMESGGTYQLYSPHCGIIEETFAAFEI